MVKYMKAELDATIALTVAGAVGVSALYLGAIAAMMYHVGVAAGYLV